MPDNKPLISVVIPTHNRLSFLKRAIASVEQQTWQPVELLIVDDASGDGTAEYLQSLRPAVHSFQFIINDRSIGGARARNLGIKKSTGEYVTFLDDDDTWNSDKILQQYSLFVSTPGCTAVSCSYVHLSSFGHKKKFDVHIPGNLQELLCCNSLGGTSLLFTSRVSLDKTGFFDESLRSSQDWDLWIRLYQVGIITTVNEPLANYESHVGFRISTNMQSVYEGRKVFYVKYKNLMTIATRKINIAAILFARIHKESANSYYLLKRTLYIVQLIGIKAGKKYIYWTLIMIAKRIRGAN